MAGSLHKLAQLPGDTEVYCAHEYTQSNIRFARAVEPENAALSARSGQVDDLRARRLPTVPSTIELERATNPFLRCEVPQVAATARSHGAADSSPLAVFAALREWKNHFK